MQRVELAKRCLSALVAMERAVNGAQLSETMSDPPTELEMQLALLFCRSRVAMFNDSWSYWVYLRPALPHLFPGECDGTEERSREMSERISSFYEDVERQLKRV